MNKYDEHEMEINIFTLIWFVLSKWKSIIIIAIIGLLLGGAYGAVSVSNDNTGVDIIDAGVAEEEIQKYEAAKQIYEANVERVAQLESYVAESALMAMNPYELYKGSVVYALDCKARKLPSVENSLYGFAWDGELLSELADAGPYTIKELETLLYTSTDESNAIVMNEVEIGQSVMRITILAKTEEEANDLLSQIETSMEVYLNILVSKQDIIGYEIVSSGVKETISTTLADYQANMLTRYNNEKATIDTNKLNMEALEPADVDIVASTDNSKDSIIKYAGIGFVVGVVIAVVIWLVVYFLCDRLYTVSDKETRFNVKQLGSVYNFEKLRGLDLIFGYKLGGVYSKTPLNEQRKIVLLAIKRELEKNTEIKNVFVASTWGDSLEETINIKAFLESNGYSVFGCENVIGNSEALKVISQCDATIIVEDNKKSKNSLVREEVGIINQYVDHLMGMVIVQDKA